MRRQRKAKAVIEPNGFEIQFIPGGFYHLKSGKLYTGIKHNLASEKIAAKLLPLAVKAIETPNVWVTK